MVRWRSDRTGYGLVTRILHWATVVLVAVLRLGWRLATSLPPWAEALSARERRVSHVVEVVLYTCLFLVPLTGLGLFLLSGEDWELGFGRVFVGPREVLDDDTWLAAHVAAQVVFLAALAVHVGSALYHQVVRRDGLLSRML